MCFANQLRAIFHFSSPRWLRTRCSRAYFSTLRSHKALENTVFRDFSTLSRPCIFFLLTLCLLWSSFFFLSLLILPTSDLLILSEVPNRESVGFQSLGPGSGDKKMHAPKNRNSPGTLLGPSSGTLLEPCCNLAGTLWNLTSVEPCWNLGGALLKLRWKLAGIAGALQEHGETLLEPCGNPVAGTAGWNIFLWTTACCVCGHRFSCFA